MSKYVKHYGPPKNAVKALKKFKTKYKKVSFEGKKSYTMKKREWTTIEPLIKQLIQQDNVKKRVKSIKIKK